jgi:hypothetical protein
MSPRPPVAKQAGDAAGRFCVLTLDGGGARGYLTLKLLEHAESCLDTCTGTRVPLGERFDLVCGTSTGGIIALALALGHPVREVSALYETRLPRIFGPAMRRMSWVDVLRPRYRADALREAMQAFFGDLMLADVRTDVCVTATSLVNARPQLFCSDYLGRWTPDSNTRIADLALATSAAPTFFAAHSTEHQSDLVDGGLYANNPALIGVAEAFRFGRPSRRGVAPPHDLGASCLDRLSVLSVGSGEQCAMPYDPARLRAGGWLAWGAHFYSVASESQTQYVDLLAEGLLGASYHRINPRLDFPMAMDDVPRLPSLKNLAVLSAGDEAFLRERIGARAEHADAAG